MKKLIWIMLVLIIFVGAELSILENKIKKIEKILPRDHTQTLATECYVKAVVLSQIKRDNGYFYNKGNKTLGEILEESNTEYKIKYEESSDIFGLTYIVIKWLPKKDFCKYFTLDELSEIEWNREAL